MTYILYTTHIHICNPAVVVVVVMVVVGGFVVVVVVINEVVVCLTVTQTSTNFNQMWLRTIHMYMPVSATVAFSITSSVPLYLIT